MMTTAHTNAIIDAQPDRLDTDLVSTIVSFLPGEERTLAEHLEWRVVWQRRGGGPR